MWACVHVHMCVVVHINMRAHVCRRAHVHQHRCVHAFAEASICSCTSMCSHTNKRMNICTDTCMHAHAHILWHLMLRWSCFIPGKETEKKAKCRGVPGSDILTTGVEVGPWILPSPPWKSCGKSPSGRGESLWPSRSSRQRPWHNQGSFPLRPTGSSPPGMAVLGGLLRVTRTGLAELGSPLALPGWGRSSDRAPGQLSIWFTVDPGYLQ